MNEILPGHTIGILGGGQLGKMSAQVARQMGYHVVVLDPTPNCPAAQVSDRHIVGSYTNRPALDKLARACDVVTYEFENVPAASVERLTRHRVPVYPAANLLAVAQSRLREKQFARDLGLSTADFYAVTTQTDLDTAATQVGFPALLKTDGGGYDGKGQMVLNADGDQHNLVETVTKQPLIWERRVEFTKELSVICARNAAGDIAVYPVAENIHVTNILDTSIVPARISEAVQSQAQAMARQIVEALEVVGVVGIELFLLPDDTLLFNEMAPRPHNSGHYTIEACVTSQFEQHIRAVCGLPLGATTLRAAAVMVNILGTGAGDHLTGLAEVLKQPDVHFHLYGKAEAREGRKMGHLTVLADEVEQALAVAQSARQQLIWD